MKSLFKLVRKKIHRSATIPRNTSRAPHTLPYSTSTPPSPPPSALLCLAREGFSQIAHGFQRVGMIGSQHPRQRCKHLVLHLHRLSVLSLAREGFSKIARNNQRVGFYFFRSTGQALYGAKSACAKRAAYPDPPLSSDIG